MRQVWYRTRVFVESEQRIAEQVRQVCVNGWLKEIKEIRCRCKIINPQLICTEQFAFAEPERNKQK